MRTRTIVCRLKPYIQPFERQLALGELARLARAKPSRARPGVAIEFAVKTAVSPARLASRLAYWELIGTERPVLTTQVLREATVNVVRNGIPLGEIEAVLPFEADPPLPNRRCLRYGPHGVHEYRGKFFPQLVRALLNTADVPKRGVVVDTMCGSGTAVVEAALLGCTGIGLDINPLSVLMSRTKCELLHCRPESIARTYERVRNKLLAADRPDDGNSRPWLRSLPKPDQEYLRDWFAPQVLADLDRIVAAIQAVRATPERNLLWLSLSNILRKVSWQREDDLRVRRDIRLDVENDPVKEFLEGLGRSVRTILAFLLQLRGMRLGRSIMLEGDARAPQELLAAWCGRVDAVVTSPPYATALPYLDTDRLSLIYLQLLTRPEHRRRDAMMVGNREITDRDRRAYWEAYRAHRRALPGSIVRLVDRVHRLNRDSDVGFRRRNLAALLAKYFTDMERVFQGLHVLLKRRAPAYVVIGNNHTYAGGERVEIETAKLLGDLAEVSGFVLENNAPMEMLVSRDIFRKNAVGSEAILSLRKA